MRRHAGVLELRAFDAQAPAGVASATVRVAVTAVAHVVDGLSEVAADGTRCALSQVQLRPCGTFLVHQEFPTIGEQFDAAVRELNRPADPDVVVRYVDRFGRELETFLRPATDELEPPLRFDVRDEGPPLRVYVNDRPWLDVGRE